MTTYEYFPNYALDKSRGFRDCQGSKGSDAMAETMKLQKATYTVTGKVTVIELVYADAADLAEASASIVIRVPSEAVSDPKEFATARVEALVRAQNLIAAEIDAMK